MDVGNQIRERRQALGLSQEELAQRLYVSRVTVSHWETGRTLPDVQCMLLLSNLFGTTIDEMVRGDVDEMREMVEKDERRKRAFAIALVAVEVAVIAVLVLIEVVGRDYVQPVLRLLLAALVLVPSVASFVSRHGEGSRSVESAAELLFAALGGPTSEQGGGRTNAQTMAIVLQVVEGIAVGIGVLAIGDLLLDPNARAGLAVAAGLAVVLLAFWAIGGGSAGRRGVAGADEAVGRPAGASCGAPSRLRASMRPSAGRIIPNIPSRGGTHDDRPLADDARRFRYRMEGQVCRKSGRCCPVSTGCWTNSYTRRFTPSRTSRARRAP